MFVVKHRVRPELNKPGGIVATEVIPTYATVWSPNPSRDVVLTFDELKRLTEIEFELVLQLGFIQLPYNSGFVVPVAPFARMRLSSLTHDRNPNLSILYDTLVAARQIKKGEELICPADFDQSLNWKRRLSRNGYKRANNVNPAKPTLAGYLRYVRRQQRGVR